MAHTEIDRIVANSGHAVPFSNRVGDSDHISVYPTFEALDVSPLVRLQPEMALGEVQTCEVEPLDPRHSSQHHARFLSEQSGLNI